MNIRFFKLAMLVSTILITILHGIVFFTAQTVGSAFLMLVQSSENNLPTLTSGFSLPFLGAIAPGSLDPVESAWWVVLLWTACFMSPWLALLWSWRAPVLEASVSRWLVVMSIYLPFLAILVVLVIAGLVAAVAPI